MVDTEATITNDTGCSSTLGRWPLSTHCVLGSPAHPSLLSCLLVAHTCQAGLRLEIQCFKTDTASALGHLAKSFLCWGLWRTEISKRERPLQVVGQTDRQTDTFCLQPHLTAARVGSTRSKLHPPAIWAWASGLSSQVVSSLPPWQWMLAMCEGCHGPLLLQEDSPGLLPHCPLWPGATLLSLSSSVTQ